MPSENPPIPPAAASEPEQGKIEYPPPYNVFDRVVARAFQFADFDFEFLDAAGLLGDDEVAGVRVGHARLPRFGRVDGHGVGG